MRPVHWLFIVSVALFMCGIGFIIATGRTARDAPRIGDRVAAPVGSIKQVGTTKVTTNASTQFRDGTCDALKVGSHVEVKGSRQTDGSILAASVERDGEDENEDREHELELKGTVAACIGQMAT